MTIPGMGPVGSGPVGTGPVSVADGTPAEESISIQNPTIQSATVCREVRGDRTMTVTERVYIGRDNEIRLALYNDDVVWTADQIATITKAEISINGEFFDSDDNPEAFDLTSYAADGTIGLTLGHIITTAGKDRRAELILYTADNPHGFVQGAISITVDPTVMPMA